MTYENAKTLLAEKGQSHILQYYPSLSEAQQQSLLVQIEALDWSLLDILEKEDRSVPKGHLEPMGAVEITEIKEKEAEYRKSGLDAIRAGKVACVMLAGGQGTRLGLDKPKGTLNVGISTTLYLFQCLIRNLQRVTDEAGCYVPLYIMTSEKNKEDTVAFFKEHDFFGYPSEEVTFFVQEMAPSVDYNGKIYLEAKDRISLSPNGNGGWFISMARAGLLEGLHQRGVEWLQIFSVDNVLQALADPVMVGAMIQKGFHNAAKVVSKADPDERIGVLCLEDGRPSIVEYYEMTDAIRNTVLENGQLAYRFGVTLNYYFSLRELESILDQKMPLHVVEKKIPHLDENGQLVKPESPNGYKFETLILDMVNMVSDCLPVECVREHEFAPIKNLHGIDSLDTARELLRKNGVTL